MELVKNVSLQLDKNDKFKDIGISIRFMAPLRKEIASLRSLLAIMICDRCEKYPTKKQMSDIQDNLYGTQISAQTVGYGKAQVLEIRTRVIDPRYVKDKELLQSVFEYIHEALFHPLLNEAAFNEAKAVLKAKLMRLRDDAAQYVVAQGLRLAGAGNSLAISSLGDLEELEKLTLDDVLRAHKHLLHEERIDMIVCGPIDEAQITALIQQHLSFQARDVDLESHYVFHSEQASRYEKEQRVVNQCNIFMMWQTNIGICDADYYPLRVANAMFGQYPTSLLFREVREKRSLCYNILASLISFDGAMVVTTGVEAENIDQAIDVIHTQFQRIGNGEFDEELMTVSTTMIVNSLRASKDSMPSVIAQLYQNQVLNQSISIDERIKRIQAVTIDDVKRVFKNCRHCMSFVVCQEDDQDETD